MQETRVMRREEQVKTLEDLIYGIRHIVGAVKTDVIGNLGNSEAIPALKERPIRELETVKLAEICGEKYLRTKFAEFSRTMAAILKDPLFVAADPLRSQAENEAMQRAYQHKVKDLLEGMASLPNSNLKGLTNLSKIAEQFYDLLKPVAKQARFFDLKTGLRLSDWLENNMLDSVKDYISQGKDFAFSYIDMNNLRESNNTVGHDQTDVALSEFAKFLKMLPEGVQVARRSEGGADEFYLLSKLDADGARNVLDHKLVSKISKELMDKVKSASLTKLKKYRTGFETAGFKYSCAIGTTSTHLPGAPSIFQRTAQHYREDADHEKLVEELMYLDRTPLEDRAKEYRKEETEFRREILFAIRKQLVDEAELAMWASKNAILSEDPKKAHSLIFVYDPSKSPEFYNLKKTG